MQSWLRSHGHARKSNIEDYRRGDGKHRAHASDGRKREGGVEKAKVRTRYED